MASSTSNIETSTTQKYTVRDLRRFTPARALSFGFQESWLKQYVTTGKGPDSVPRRLEAIISAWASQFVYVSKRRLFKATLEGPSGSLTRTGEADILIKQGRDYSLIEVKSSVSTHVITDARRQLYFLSSLLHSSSEQLKGCTVFIDMNENSFSKLSLDQLHLAKTMKHWTNLKDRETGFVPVVHLSGRHVWEWGIRHGVEKSWTDFNTYSEKIQRPSKTVSKKLKDVPSDVCLDGSKYINEALTRLAATQKHCGYIFKQIKDETFTANALQHLLYVCGFDIGSHERDLFIACISHRRPDLAQSLDDSHSVVSRYFNTTSSRDLIFAAICDTLEATTAQYLKTYAKARLLDCSVEQATQIARKTESRDIVLSSLVTSQNDLYELCPECFRVPESTETKGRLHGIPKTKTSL